MRPLLFILLLFISYSSIAQTQEQINYNKEYNDILYLCQQSWRHLETNGANKITIYNGKGKPVKVHTFKSSKHNEEVYMDKIISSLYSIDDSITKIRIDNYLISIVNNRLKSDFGKPMLNCINQHVIFCKNQEKVTHNQNEITYDNRLDLCKVTGTGLVSENCAKTFKMGSTRMDIRRVMKAYYDNKHHTLHFLSFMMKGYRFYTTSIVRDETHTYSVTIFTEYKTDDI